MVGDLPTGQVSFHTAARGGGPEYAGDWDGVRDVAPMRIARWIAGVLALRYESPPQPGGVGMKGRDYEALRQSQDRAREFNANERANETEQRARNTPMHAHTWIALPPLRLSDGHVAELGVCECYAMRGTVRGLDEEYIVPPCGAVNEKVVDAVGLLIGTWAAHALRRRGLS